MCSPSEIGHAPSSAAWRLLTAVLIVPCFVAIEIMLERQVPYNFHMPFLVTMLGVLISARVCGWIPGLVTLGLFVPSIIYFFLDPKMAFKIATPSDAVQVICFVVEGIIVVGLVRSAQVARSAAAAMAQKSADDARLPLVRSGVVVVATSSDGVTIPLATRRLRKWLRL